MSFSIDINLAGLERFATEHESIQEEAAMRAALEMRRYVPVDQGTLRGSEPTASNYKAGLLIWNTPYAARHYYVPMNHATEGTQDHWDEAWRRNDMPAYLKYVELLYGRYLT